MNWVRITGWMGLVAALLVGFGEFCLQYTPNGGIEDLENYLYFNDISPERLSMGPVSYTHLTLPTIYSV